MGIVFGMLQIIDRVLNANLVLMYFSIVMPLHTRLCYDMMLQNLRLCVQISNIVLPFVMFLVVFWTYLIL